MPENRSVEKLSKEEAEALIRSMDKGGRVFLRAALIHPKAGHAFPDQWVMAEAADIERIVASGAPPESELMAASGLCVEHDDLSLDRTPWELSVLLGPKRFAWQTADFQRNGNSECRLCFFAIQEAPTADDFAQWRRVAERPVWPLVAAGGMAVACAVAGLALLASAHWMEPWIGRHFLRSPISSVLGAVLCGLCIAGSWAAWRIFVSWMALKERPLEGWRPAWFAPIPAILEEEWGDPQAAPIGEDESGESPANSLGEGCPRAPLKKKRRVPGFLRERRAIRHAVAAALRRLERDSR